MPKTIAIIQARMRSSRLPGKILKDLCGKPVLSHVVDRIRQAKKIDDIIIATTVLSHDDVVSKLAEASNVKWFRGSESDVLSRYYYAALENKAETIVRITSDCPLFDPHIADTIIRFFHANRFDIVTNAGALDGKRTYPPGMDTEVFTMECLSDAFQFADKQYQREHVTPYIYQNKSNQVYDYQYEKDCSHIRLTLDTPEDYEVIAEVYKRCYRGRHDFYLEDILRLYNEEPHLFSANRNVKQKKFDESASD